MIRRILPCAALALSLATAQADAQQIVGLTTNNMLTSFDAATPGMVTAMQSLSGVDAGQTIVGIDYRPNTGELYGLGYDATQMMNNARLYTINPTTGMATGIGTAVTLSLGSGNIGFDFNPTVDRIRVVAANGANYRLHPVTGAIAATDGNLAYAAGDANDGATPSVGSVAYTNSYIGAETTTLFGIDDALGILLTQNPPNNGILNTIGSTGLMYNMMDLSTDFDIYFDSATKTNMAYLAANTGTSMSDDLYTIDLATGATTMVGTIGTGNVELKDIAVVITRNTPALSGNLVYALTRMSGHLVSFDSENPSYLRTWMPVTGVATGQVLVGMDVRPANLQLYALGYNSTNDEYQLYTMDPATAMCTPVGATGTLMLGMGSVGFDFNPTVDRIRVVGSNGANYRLNPLNGMIAATDTMLTYAMGDVAFGTMPSVGSVAYTNSYMGAASTMLYGLEDATGSLVGIPAPNSGVMNTLNANLFMVNMMDMTSDIDMFFDSTSGGSDIAYLSVNTGSSNNDDFYMMTTMGMPMMVGSIGLGVGIKDIAAQLQYTGMTSLSAGSVSKAGTVLSVYPNPASNSLNILLPSDVTEMEAIVTDVTGREVLRTAQRNVAIGHLASGVYLLQVSAGNGEQYAPVRFVKE